jgi:type IV secretion system protein VirB3
MQKPEEDILFLACTRPAMFAGVTMEAFGLNAVVTSIIYMAAGSIFYSVVGVFIHFILVGVLRHDPNRLRLLWRCLGTKGRSRNVLVWGGSSVAPNRLFRKYKMEDVLA